MGAAFKAASGGRPVATQETPAGGAPPLQSPFPLRDRALRASASGEAFVSLPEPRAADPFTELFDARRWHSAAHAVVIDSDSEAVRDVRRRERIYRRSLAGADALAAAIAVLVAIDVIGGYQLRPLYLLVVPLMVLAAKVGASTTRTSS